METKCSEKTFLRQTAFLEELHMELLMGEKIGCLGFHLKYFKRENQIMHMCGENR